MFIAPVLVLCKVAPDVQESLGQEFLQHRQRFPDMQVSAICGNSSDSPSDTPPRLFWMPESSDVYLSEVKINSSFPNPERLSSKKSQQPVILLGLGTHAR